MTIYFEDVYEAILNDAFGEKEGKKYQDVERTMSLNLKLFMH